MVVMTGLWMSPTITSLSMASRSSLQGKRSIEIAWSDVGAQIVIEHWPLYHQKDGINKRQGSQRRENHVTKGGA
jgi:hypothetical protein